MLRFALALMLLALSTIGASATDGPTRPRILEPGDGETVPHQFVVRFSPILETHGSAAGNHNSSGMHSTSHAHLHLLIDATLPRPGEPVPMDDRHLHFMGGEESATLVLPAGRHTLQLLVGNSDHMPARNPIVSRRITIMVE